jgi:hypothetical protein
MKHYLIVTNFQKQKMLDVLETLERSVLDLFSTILKRKIACLRIRDDNNTSVTNFFIEVDDTVVSTNRRCVLGDSFFGVQVQQIPHETGYQIELYIKHNLETTIDIIRVQSFSQKVNCLQSVIHLLDELF